MVTRVTWLAAGLLLVTTTTSQAETGTTGKKAVDPYADVDIVSSYSLTIVVKQSGTKFFGCSHRGGNWDLFEVPEGTRGTIVVSQGVGILALEGGTISEIAAFSPFTGKWHTCALKQPTQSKIIPIVSEEMAAIAVDGYVYAFAPKVGAWDVIPSAADPGVVGDYVRVQDDKQLAIFGNETGKWAVLKLSDLK